jgi:putative hydroxymethylpyrimidine transport system permease protein
MKLLRALVTCAGLVAIWWGVQAGLALPRYLLPSPASVARALLQQRGMLAESALTTLAETVLGLAIGTVLGAGAALLMAASPALRRWLLPVLLLSQAVPLFALAPLLVLWLGFGMASKVAAAVVMIFFPISAATFDGLRCVPQDFLDLAHTMGASAWRVLLHIRLPAALPYFGTGVRMAAALAPIGAVIGEWVGASSGLGYVMLNANARVRTDVMFAALVVLSLMTVGLWAAVDWGVRRMLYWRG